MFDRIVMPLAIVFTLFVTWWVGSGLYRYFTYQTPPAIELKGIVPDGSFARIAEGSVCSNNPYKVSTIKFTLDDKELFTHSIRAKQFEHHYTIDTTNIPDGQHTLEIKAIDSSYNSNTTIKKFIINIDNSPLRATFVAPEYTVDQGKTLQLKIQANKKLAGAQINYLSSTYEFHPENDGSTVYECFIPINCEEHAQESMPTTTVQDLVGNKLTLSCKVTVKPFEFPRQRGFSVDSGKMTQEREISMNMKVLDEALNKWLKESPKQKLWHGPFEFPIEVKRMSTPFGEIRMTPERGRYMHQGVDLINRPKSVIWAAQVGKVIVKDRFVLTGNTVVLDHGCGIFTLYGHLEEFADMEIGDLLKKGSPVGKIGMTGYAAGYHLHWEVRVNNTPVDPLQWTSKVY